MNTAAAPSVTNKPGISAPGTLAKVASSKPAPLTTPVEGNVEPASVNQMYATSSLAYLSAASLNSKATFTASPIFTVGLFLTVNTADVPLSAVIVPACGVLGVGAGAGAPVNVAT